MIDTEIKKILENSKTIAMVGVSSEKKGEDKAKFKKKTCKCCYEIYARLWL
tara:strand:- start:184 stop:336 length:153 start_codon:yes stop_codon:yes gene_type:complete